MEELLGSHVNNYSKQLEFFIKEISKFKRTRELSLAITKLQEANMWLKESYK